MYHAILKRLSSIAQSVRASILYDVDFKIDKIEFFRTKRTKECIESNKLCKTLYKYYHDVTE